MASLLALVVNRAIPAVGVRVAETLQAAAVYSWYTVILSTLAAFVFAIESRRRPASKMGGRQTAVAAE